MSLNPKDEQFLVQSFKPAVPEKTKNVKPHRIKVDGKFVTLDSRKTIWNNIGPAKSALRNHLRSQRLPSQANAWSRGLTDEQHDEFVAKHVEFVPV